VDFHDVETFAAVLTLGVIIGIVALVAGWVLRSINDTAAELMSAINTMALWFAFAVGAVSTAGSLYFSEVAHFIPCNMCWYQRICMYPMTLLLGIAAVRRDHTIRRYVIPLAAVGMCLSLYHYLIEWFPSIETDGACGLVTTCSAVYFRKFGFVSFPFMALCGFAFIIVLLATLTGQNTSSNDDEDNDDLALSDDDLTSPELRNL
jgi:disulfide bond formation protein DsbB